MFLPCLNNYPWPYTRGWCCEAWSSNGCFIHRCVHTCSWLIPALNMWFFPVISPYLGCQVLCRERAAPNGCLQSRMKGLFHLAFSYQAVIVDSPGVFKVETATSFSIQIGEVASRLRVTPLCSRMRLFRGFLIFLMLYVLHPLLSTRYTMFDLRTLRVVALHMGCDQSAFHACQEFLP